MTPPLVPILGIIVLVSIPPALLASLLDHSPFLPPDLPAPPDAVATQLPTAPAKLEFRAVYEINGVWKFLIYDATAQKSSWVPLNQPPYYARDFERATGSLTIGSVTQSSQLTLTRFSGFNGASPSTNGLPANANPATRPSPRPLHAIPAPSSALIAGQLESAAPLLNRPNRSPRPANLPAGIVLPALSTEPSDTSNPNTATPLQATPAMTYAERKAAIEAGLLPIDPARIPENVLPPEPDASSNTGEYAARLAEREEQIRQMREAAARLRKNAGPVTATH